jgi:hypothetical protein
MRMSDIKSEIIKTMIDVGNSDDAKSGHIWWMPSGAIHETIFDRLFELYLLAGGTEDEIKAIWPELF